ncbi:MAG: hypothetical protein ACOYJG_08600 [Prevotella sp.]
MKTKFTVLGLAMLLISGATGATQLQMSDDNTSNVKLVTPTSKTSKVGKLLKEDSVSTETLIDEDFSLMTKGTPESPDTVLLSSVNYDNYPYIADSLTHKPGWSSRGAYQAGGCVSLGNSDENGGCINVPLGDYSGLTTVTFRAKNIGTRKAYIFINFCKGGLEYPEAIELSSTTTKTMKKGEDWKEFTFTYENKYGGADCFVQINAAYCNILVDDVKITTKFTVLPAPIMAEATDFTINGFTANWSSVAKATDYLLTVFRQVPTVEADSVNVTEDFEAMELNEDGTLNQESVPEGWEIKLHGNPGLYVQDSEGTLTGDVSLRMATTGDTITTPYNGGMIMHFNMHIWKVKTPDEGTSAKIHLQVYDGTRWSDFSSFSVADGIPSTTKPANLFLDYNLGTTPTFYQIRLIAEDFDEGTEVSFDDLDMWTTTPTRNDTVIKDRVVKENKCVLDDLDPYSDYFYYAVSRNTERDMISPMPEKVINAFGVATPTALEAENVNDRGSFDAKWTTVPKATSYIVDFYKIYKANQDESNYTVLDEDFNGAMTSGTVDAPVDVYNYQLSSLDDYTTTPDWYGRWNITAESALGVEDISTVQERGELQSPILSLGNGDKTAHISLKVCGAEGDYLIVSNQYGRAAYVPLTGEYKEYSFDLTDCQNDEILLFTSYNGGWFLLDNVKVTQDLKAWDEVWKKTQIVEVEGNSSDTQHFGSLTEEENTYYGYTVTAKYVKNARTAYSKISNRICVDPFLTGITSPESNNVIMGRQEMYDLQGRRIENLNGQHGVFIVKMGNKTQKVIKK